VDKLTSFGGPPSTETKQSKVPLWSKDNIFTHMQDSVLSKTACSLGLLQQYAEQLSHAAKLQTMLVCVRGGDSNYERNV
jgi:hypothetical protein